MVINVIYNKNLVQNWNRCQNRRTATYELVNRALNPDKGRYLPLASSAEEANAVRIFKMHPPPPSGLRDL
jgi:hypothetical protein